MHYKYSPKIVKKLKTIGKKDKKLAKKIQKQLNIFKFKPNHPSLRIHKLSGKKHEAWSISITMSVRMIYKIIDEEYIYFIDIGTHEEVYNK